MKAVNIVAVIANQPVLRADALLTSKQYPDDEDLQMGIWAAGVWEPDASEYTLCSPMRLRPI